MRRQEDRVPGGAAFFQLLFKDLTVHITPEKGRLFRVHLTKGDLQRTDPLRRETGDLKVHRQTHQCLARPVTIASKTIHRPRQHIRKIFLRNRLSDDIIPLRAAKAFRHKILITVGRQRKFLKGTIRRAYAPDDLSIPGAGIDNLNTDKQNNEKEHTYSLTSRYFHGYVYKSLLKF
jgi:hypothetical protein